ncbi:hypothetical protein K0B96_06560 [Horticoccus luteus]|uniref:Uncharacterized protein n=1 Tax=Horticoccus luteus TaxID=2862869 RepID=A0A8F9TYD4_9BACT|nr:hypothetical protein [Horticoccus luteus]QYM80271.1 hypothetical protein K0B96_06560 [Horticoccus luteus]
MKKESGFLVLIGLLGAGAGGWAADIFGARAVGSLLMYSGGLATAFFFVARMINAAFNAMTELQAFDRLTRDRYELAIRTLRRRFIVRLIVGLALSFLTVGAGVLLKEAVAQSTRMTMSLAAFGGAALLVAAVMVGAQLWAASWAGDYIAECKRIAREQNSTRERLANYSLGKLHT